MDQVSWAKMRIHANSKIQVKISYKSNYIFPTIHRMLRGCKQAIQLIRSLICQVSTKNKECLLPANKTTQ